MGLVGEPWIHAEKEVRLQHPDVTDDLPAKRVVVVVSRVGEAEPVLALDADLGAGSLLLAAQPDRRLFVAECRVEHADQVVGHRQVVDLGAAGGERRQGAPGPDVVVVVVGLDRQDPLRFPKVRGRESPCCLSA